MLNKLKSSQIAFLLFAVLILFSACSKDQEVTPTEPARTTENVSFFQMQTDRTNDGTMSEEDSLDMDCFSIVYPIEVLFPDGGSQTANSDDEVETIFMSWLAQNPTSQSFPTFQFPIQVTLEDGTTESIADEEQLCTLLEACWEYDDDDLYGDSLDLDIFYCSIELIYPLEVKFPDGTTASASDEETLTTLIFDWFEANPDSEELPTFVYPIQVQTDDGLLSINSDEELEVLFETTCDVDYHEECFSINYPVQIVFPDGTTADVDSNEALDTAVDNWYEQNPNSEEDPTFAYPIEVTLTADGSTQSINNDEELDDLFIACYGEDCEVNGEELFLGGSETIATKAVIRTQ